jgi:hypothetical protein
MIFERQINRGIKKRTCSLYMLFSSFLSLSPYIYLSTISIRVISYRISSSGFFYVALPYSDNNKRENQEREEKKTKRRTIFLILRSFFFYLYPESFIHNLFSPRSFPLWSLSIKYYPEATRDKEQEETQPHTDCFDYSV